MYRKNLSTREIKHAIKRSLDESVKLVLTACLSISTPNLGTNARRRRSVNHIAANRIDGLFVSSNPFINVLSPLLDRVCTDIHWIVERNQSPRCIYSAIYIQKLQYF